VPWKQKFNEENEIVKTFNFIKMIEQKGITFDHDVYLPFSFPSSLFFWEGREKGKRITKVVVKSHAFLLDL
jgi:hypothetical protein